MAEEVVLLATGADRPGIVDELSEFLLECGANITDSRSVNLRGQFALLLLVRGDAAALGRIRAGLSALCGSGISLSLQPASRSDSASFPYVFTATGKDQTGVLHRISHLLRALKINIDEVQTHVAEDASFQIRLTLSVARETPITMLREYLGVLCGEINVEWSLAAA
jgi:glycine cleavage system transcriptional repressor